MGDVDGNEYGDGDGDGGSDGDDDDSDGGGDGDGDVWWQDSHVGRVGIGRGRRKTLWTRSDLSKYHH